MRVPWKPTQIEGCVLWVRGGSSVQDSASVTDADMEAADCSAWTAKTDAVLTKETDSPHSGTKYLKATYGSAATDGIKQVCLTQGKYYRLSAWVKCSTSLTVTVSIDGSVSESAVVGTSWYELPTEGFCDGAASIIEIKAAGMSGGDWLAVDDISIECYSSNSWTDLSGNGHHLVQAVDAAKPRIERNSCSSMYFNGAGYKVAGAWSQAQPLNYFLVAKTHSLMDGYLFEGTGDVNKCAVFGESDTILRMYAPDIGEYVEILDATLTLYDVIFDGADSKIAINYAAYSATADCGTNDSDGLSIPAINDAQCEVIEYKEIVIYDRVLTAAERERISYYLMLRHNINPPG